MPGSRNPTNLTALTPKVTADNGGPFGGLLQPSHQSAYTSVSASPTQAEVTALRTAIVSAGIMKAA